MRLYDEGMNKRVLVYLLLNISLAFGTFLSITNAHEFIPNSATSTAYLVQGAILFQILWKSKFNWNKWYVGLLCVIFFILSASIYIPSFDIPTELSWSQHRARAYAQVYFGFFVIFHLLLIPIYSRLAWIKFRQ